PHAGQHGPVPAVAHAGPGRPIMTLPTIPRRKDPMSKRRPMLASLFILCSAALAPAWAGGDPRPSGEAARPELASERSGLAGALEAIGVRGIQADIEFIASDDLLGRNTPSEGLEIAARYIRSRLMRIGFEPGAPEHSFFHEYALRTTAM